MEAKGKIHHVGETQQVTDSFTKRELIVEIADNPQFPEFVKFEAIQDKCSLLDELRTGDEVEVFFNLKGREWTNKQGEKQYFNTLQLWKVNIGKTTPASNPEPKYATPLEQSNPDEDDDLPF